MSKKKKQMALFLVLILVSSLFLTPLSMAAPKEPGLPGQVNDPDTKPAYVEGEVIVKFKPAVASEQANAVKAGLALRTSERFFLTGSEVAKIENGKSVDETVRELSKNPNVLYAQPNYLYYPQAAAPDDTYFPNLWGLNNTGQTINSKTGVNDIDIDALEAWDFSMGSVVVAVIDEGVDINHPDIAANIWVNTAEQTGTAGVDDDGNGYIDDVNGWDFYNNDKTVFDAEDLDQHGTHVAGTIAAVANNANGIAGVAPNVKIMPLKFLGPNGGSTTNAIKAIQYATNKGVKISNNSWGLPGTDLALKDAIDVSGQVFVAAAGNDSANVDTTPYSPAGLSSANIISVAAVYNQGGLAGFSNYGSATIDIGAPGEGIYSLKPVYPAMGSVLQIYDPTYGYKAVHFGFGLEDIASDADRAAVMQRALNFLDTTPSTPIMLVDDDNSNAGSPDYFPQIYAALNGYNVASIVYAGNDIDGPPAGTMAGKTVIWFTGDAYGSISNNTLTANDLFNLQSFLDGGGRLILIGEDIANGNESDSLFTVYMEEKVINDFTPSSTVVDAVYSYTYALPPSTDRDTLVSKGISVPMYNYAASDPATSYQYKDGTSMAAPHVAGIAALMLSVNPSLTPAQLIDLLKHPQNIDPLAALNVKTATGGMANAYKAVLAAKVPATPTGLTATAGNQNVQLNWTVVSDADLAGYNIYRNGVKVNGSPVTGTSYTDTGLTNGTTYNYELSSLDNYGFESPRTPVVSATPYLAQVSPTLTVTGKTAAKNDDTLQFGGTTTVGANVYSAKLEQLDGTGAHIASADINVTSDVTISSGNIGGSYTVPSFDPYAKSVRLNLTVDISGTKYSETSAPFAVDTTAPDITGKNPLANATGVLVSGNVEITFSEPMDTASINSSNIVLTSVYGTESAVVSYDSVNKKAIIDPANPLKYLTQYTVTVTANVYDPAGNAVTGAPVSWNFTTEPDTYPPEIVPQIASTNVSVDSLITFTFNEEVVASTVYDAIYNNHILLKKGSETVTSAVEYNSATKIVTIKPAANLEYSTTYSVSVAGISDLLNNTISISSPKTWSFTTAAAPSSGGGSLPEEPTLIEKEVTTDSGAQITLGDVKIDLPGGLDTENLKVTVEKKQLNNDDTKGFNALKAIDLTFKTVTSNKEVTSLQKPVTITFSYSSLELGSIPASKLSIYYKQTLSDKYWIPVKSKVDSLNRKVTAEVDHATIFALMIDTTAPAAPVLEQIPASSTKRVLTVKGQVEPYTTAQLFINGKLSGYKETGSAGMFSLDVLLPAGENKISAKAVDAAGNIGYSSAETTINVNPAISVKDIKDHWAELPVQKLLENGNITGYPDKTFRPENRVTRAEFTVMVMNALGMGIQPYKELKFADNDNIPAWARTYIGLAVEKGIIKGDNKNNFRPSDLITREEMAVIIVRALNPNFATVADNSEAGFTDKNDIGSWAREAVAAAVEKGIISGYGDNSFRPKNRATRAEAAVMILKLMETK